MTKREEQTIQSKKEKNKKYNAKRKKTNNTMPKGKIVLFVLFL
jgi:hypothetical protein